MSVTSASIFPFIEIDHQFDKKRSTFFINKPKISTVMWRKVVKQSSRTLRSTKIATPVNPSNRTCSFLGFSQDPVSSQEFFNYKLLDFSSCSNIGFEGLNVWKICEFSTSNEFLGRPTGLHSARSLVNINGFCSKSYTSVAEAVAVSSTDVEEDVSVEQEVQELLTDMRREEVKQRGVHWRRRHKMAYGMGRKKYLGLQKRQVKIETEAWEQAAKEYKELLNDMCKQKLAPNLPYMKSLFLGWFEPLYNKIAEEQESFRQEKNMATYGKHLLELPAEMMAVITMHKLVGQLMTGDDHGLARVVQAACLIGDAVEQEVLSILQSYYCVLCSFSAFFLNFFPSLTLLWMAFIHLCKFLGNVDN